MSILIKGIGMPETCDDCQFHRYHSRGEYVCVATPMFYPMNLANSKGIRKDWCPLVELPEKHGRLIDADKLKEEFPKDTDWEYPVNTNQYVCETIDEAKTVVEAEDEG